jgi:hypothetical protein
VKPLRVFRYLSEVDAFIVTTEYRELATLLGLAEWNPVVWIGRLFALDNDFGEHWFDNADALADRAPLAERLGHDVGSLLVLDPERFKDGLDGPCHPPELRARFWRDVLASLELSPELLFSEARHVKAGFERLFEQNPEYRADPDYREQYIDDLDVRIETWIDQHRQDQ